MPAIRPVVARNLEVPDLSALPVRPPSGFERLWKSLQIDALTLTLAPSATLAPRRHLPDTDERRRAVAGLPEIAVQEDAPLGSPDAPLPDAASELQLGVTLGKGGMGLVRAATQVSLRRTVAVKTLQPDHLRDDTTHELLREARLTGQLEHPNIIPVYALGRDAAGAPMLVMKRVEGKSWHELLDDHPLSGQAGEGEHQGKGVAPDQLDRHLSILTQVCNAVHYAHSKGIVHRDLKPENVMLGQYGEVYVVDWGIAVQKGELGRASAGTGIAGTPAFMAPEMVSGDSAGLGPHTDVYLLGACLHTLLTGAPPHAGHDLFAVLYHAWSSDPHDYDATIPAELAALCRTAMAPKPADRPASAEVFRQGIEDFLSHRTSRQLAAEATQRLDALQALWSREDVLHGAEDEGLAAELAGEVYHVFGEARFGFTHALRTWPDNLAATEGLAQLLLGMAGYEIRHQDHRAAAVLVAEMTHVPAALQQDLDTLGLRLKDADAELRKLKALERDLDLDAGRDVRASFAWAMAIVWAVAPAAAYASQKVYQHTVGHAEYLGAGLLFAILSAVSVWLYRDELLQNRVNRAFVRVILVTAVVMLARRAIVWMLDTPVAEALVDDLLMCCFALGSLAATVDRRIAWGAGVYLLAALAAPLMKSHVFALMAVADLVALGSVAAVWSPLKACRIEHHVMLAKLRHARRLRAFLDRRTAVAAA